jgi:hypothetical protein
MYPFTALFVAFLLLRKTSIFFRLCGLPKPDSVTSA